MNASPILPVPGRHSSAVEQLFRKQQVLGSNPSVGSTPSRANPPFLARCILTDHGWDARGLLDRGPSGQHVGPHRQRGPHSRDWDGEWGVHARRNPKSPTLLIRRSRRQSAPSARAVGSHATPGGCGETTLDRISHSARPTEAVAPASFLRWITQRDPPDVQNVPGSCPDCRRRDARWVR